MRISNKIKSLAAGAASVIGAGFTTVAANATTTTVKQNEYIDATSKGQATTDLWPAVNTIINVVIGVIGFVAVVVIILGGVSYMTSAGDPGKVTKAKNTILYGVVGLIVALLAFAIVNFILNQMFGISTK